MSVIYIAMLTLANVQFHFMTLVMSELFLHLAAKVLCVVLVELLFDHARHAVKKYIDGRRARESLGLGQPSLAASA